MSAPKHVKSSQLAELTEPGTALGMVGFVDSTKYQAPKGAVVKSFAPLLKPANFPPGKVLVGKFVKMFQTTPAKGKLGLGVEILPDNSPVGVALPVVATLRTGLEISGEKLELATSPNLGKYVAIQLLPNKLPSKKGQDAWHFIVAIYPEGAQPRNSGR